MKISRRPLLIGAAAVAAMLLIAVAWLLWLTPEQRLLARSMRTLSSVLDANGAVAQPLSTTVEVLRAEGLPKQLRNARLELAVQAPDRLWAATTVDGGRIELARNRQELWVFQEKNRFAVLGQRGVQQFLTNPRSIDQTELGPLEVPFSSAALRLLPYLSNVERLPDEKIEGVNCRVLKVQPRWMAKAALKLAGKTLTLWMRESDAFPVQIRYSDGQSVDALMALRNATLGAGLPEERWQLAAPAGTHVERVALSHLTMFFESGLRMLKKPMPKPLGPATGEKRLIASHGGGRLEMHDGTRVLFLSGTPEEMGEQHGVLLREQIRDVVPRIIYGIGVGSSFAKGKWFFGTIESCEARIAKFIEPRHLREMDAIARASGFASEEIRLANFFPELFHCSGFAISGAATEGGRIYHGRILDYMKGVGLEPNAVVIVSRPDVGNPWVNITYAGFIGSVTAMNSAQLSIGEMGGRGEGNWDGKPMAQLVREVMEQAGTLDEAVEIMRRSPRTCEYYYVIADGKTKQSVGIKATPEIFEVVRPGEAHPQLDTPIADTVLLSAGDRYVELVRRVQEGYGRFNADSARELMTRPVCMSSNIHSVLFAPDTLDFWVANADEQNVASHARYTAYNLRELLGSAPALKH